MPRVRVHVQDTGQGMSPEQVARVFDPYAQGDPQQRAAEAGVGLGLAICRSFVELMDGAISATSTLGEGSTFTVELNLAQAQAAPFPTIILDRNGPPRRQPG